MTPSMHDAPDTVPLVTNLQRAVHVVGVRIEQMLSDLRLTQGEIHVLSLLGNRDSLSVAALQRNVRHRPSTLTSILDRLEGRGMVLRQINTADRRSNLIALTPAGRSAADRVLAAMADIERALLTGGSEEQVAAFVETLDAIPEKL